MHVLLYHQLHPKTIPNFPKMQRLLEAGDFRSADVKKLGENLYRARLDHSNRLLFSLYRYQGETYILVLECIANHAYDTSRFLRRGATIDEGKIPIVDHPDPAAVAPLAYLNPRLPTFHLLKKVMSFDDAQQAVYTLPPPCIVIGSAGSGKTALTLEKMKDAPGDVLYVTRSPYLVHNARTLYYALEYVNDAQDVSFLSFAEYLASLRVPQGREMGVRDFTQWFARHRAASRLKDAHALFEEFQGVITGPATDHPYLSREAYLGLGIRQSIFAADERPHVYDLFEKYLAFLQDNDYYDTNILSAQYMPLVEPRYDFVVVDEVQDLTVVQLQLILTALREPHQFVLCGDANQIVHPNFFSWSTLKRFFYQHDGRAAPADLIRILHNNYRNAGTIIDLANRVLTLKHARFGSVDRESNYLVHSTVETAGTVRLLADTEPITRELNEKTRQSTHCAVVVMHPEDKPAARAHFQTPLLFAIQEAKGLEYDNIILYNFTSTAAERFREITRGVRVEDVRGKDLRYARAREKGDKSLEMYKFHINALYVAITRAVENLYLIETDPDHRLFEVLGLHRWEEPLALADHGSSLDEWRQEARRLELQGKQEQADAIRTQILKLKDVPWEVVHGKTLRALERQAFEGDEKQAQLLLFEYALVYQDHTRMQALADRGFRPATQPEKGIKPLTQKYFFPYELKKPEAMLRQVDQYGVDFRNPFNQTPLMCAARLGNDDQVARLVALGADTGLINNVGFTAFHMVLEQACLDAHYAARKLAGVYEILAPPDMVIQVDGRLVKLDNRSMEFLLLNLMIAMFYTRLGTNVVRFGGGAFRSGDFLEVLRPFPDILVPARRKQRAYISSILAKNEVHRNDPYNRKLFRRLKQGHYIINPQLAVWVEGAWRNMYDLLSLDALGYRRQDRREWYYFDPHERMQHQLQHFKTVIQQLQRGEEPVEAVYF